MAWTLFQHFVVVLMVGTGCVNTLVAKWADNMESPGRDDVSRKFHHPFIQSICMFMGMATNMIPFKILYYIYSKRQDGSEDVHILTKGTRDFNVFILLMPSMCDMIGTSTTYIALNFTYASSYQMLRGSVIIFTGVLSMIFLKRQLGIRHWFGIFLVLFGLTIVGVSDYLSKKGDADAYATSDIVLGDIMIVLSQIMIAVQVVIEEKYVAGLDIPTMQAVGWEGIFGFSVLTTLMVPFYFIIAGRPFSKHPSGRMADAIDAFVQMKNNGLLALAQFILMISIAFFNYAGISIIKELSATTRKVLDSIRTVIIWIFSLIFLGESFQWLQLVGFILLVIGMCVYNNVFEDQVKRLLAKHEQEDNPPAPAAT